MFTAAEFRLIRENCPEKLAALLENLNIPQPDWNSADEFSSYTELDNKIIRALCEKMKSESIINGYTKLMKLGKLPFDYSETDNELLRKIVEQKSVIESCLLKESMQQTAPAKPAAAKPKSSYSSVEIEIARADFNIGIPRYFKLTSRKIIHVESAFKDKLRDLICEYFEKDKPHNVIEAIEISIKTRNGVYEPRNVPAAPAPPKYTPLPFSQKELSLALKSLQLVDDIVKSEEGR